MKTRAVALAVLLTISLFGGPDLGAFEGEVEAHPGEAPVEDARAAIKATIRDYIEGWYEGDSDRMDRSLHDELQKRIPSTDDAGATVLRQVTKERMVELTKGGGGETPGAGYEIEIHHISGPIASARVHSQEYLDYLQLVETEDGWKIANILFRSRD